MSFFDNMFSSNPEGSAVGWKELTDTRQLDELMERSHEVPVAIFKHSIRCGISAMVKAQLEADWDLNAEEVEMYYLDLIRFRDVSNLIVEKLGVWHQSPQLILIRNGEATYHASHQSIRVSKLRSSLAA